MSIGHDPAVASRRAPWLDPLLVGAVALVVALAGAWIPSYWSDEATTLRAVRLPLPDLLEFVGRRDAIHGAYYLWLHAWTQLVGESELATRLPSAVAVALAAVGVFVLGRMLTTRRTAVLAAVAFTVLPRVTLEAIEARPYALTTTFAVWLTIALLVASRRHRRRWWVLYGVGLAASVWFFIPLGLLVLVHGVFLALAPAQRRRRGARHRLLGWGISTVLALLAAMPMVVHVLGERARLLVTADPSTGDAVTWWTVLVEPWFATSAAVTVVAAGLLIVLGTRLRDRARTPGSLVLLGVLWVVLPTGALLLLGLLLGPVYVPRLLTFVTPGMALLLGAALSTGRRRWIGIVLTVLLVLASAPTYVLQRTPTGKGGGSDLASVAGYVEQHARPGDAFYLDAQGTVSTRPRQALYAYPDAFAGLDDVALLRLGPQDGRFTDRTLSVEDDAEAQLLAQRLADHDRLWVVRLATDELTGSDLERLRADGYEVAQEHTTGRSIVYLLVRREQG